MATGQESIDSAGPFVIRELTGDKRTLRLVARALPYRPFTLEGEQRHEVAEYAGNPVKTLQVFGASEKPTTIKGFWKDTFISYPSTPMAELIIGGGVGGTPLLSAKDIAALVDDMREKGQLVEVAWLHEHRQGLLARFKKDWHNIHDLEWEIDFVWVALSKNVLGKTLKVVANTAMRGVATGAASLLSSSVSDTEDAAAQRDQASSWTEKINDKLASLRDTSDYILTGAGNLAASISTPAETMRTMAGAFQGMVMDAGDLIDYSYSMVEYATLGLVRLPWQKDITGAITQFGSFTLSQGPSNAATDAENEVFALPPSDVGTSTAAAQANRDTVRAARQVRFQAARGRADAIRASEPTLLAAFVAREGQDLRDVSLRFYGTQNGWRTLMTFNRMKSSLLHAGDVVFVPRQTGEAVA